jgi:photosystem II stability/assembly factor-like uncharacterized protein
LAAFLLLSCLVLLLAACGGADGSPSATLTSPQNHLHDLLALHGSPDTVLLATHFGLFRSSDRGHTWKEVAGGAGQPMDGLMTYKLAQSPIDPRRLYCLALSRTSAAAVPGAGLYTSADAGQSWKLATALVEFPTHNVYTIGAGSSGAEQVYAILPALGAGGVYVSDDAGGHWRALPHAPADTVTGIRGEPDQAGSLFLWSTTAGLFKSRDGGRTWRSSPGINGGVYAVALAQHTIYASGDAGLYVSTDGGGQFSLVDAQHSFSSLAASTSVPNAAYALTGTSVYITANAGRSWHTAAATSQHPSLVSADPLDAKAAYVGFAFPLGLAVTTDGGASWRSALP